ncbi:MAG: hypothetical protein IT463_07715 [Planctomycetes bacterium]|nr:hypothetical protein [Planctomycetota bacterium]
MALQGTNVNRTTLGQTSGRLLDFIARQNRQLEETSLQLSSGRRILKPSSDPLGATVWLGHQSMVRRNDQFALNAENLSQAYNFADAQLGEAADVLNQLKVLAVRESNDTATAQTRRASASQALQLRTALMGIANARFAGRNLFGGKLLDKTPFDLVGEAVKYRGTDTRNSVQVGVGVQIEQTLDARPVFGVRANVVTGTRDLNARAALALTSPSTVLGRTTRLADLNGGRGIDTGGTLRLAVRPDSSTGNLVQFEADLSHAETVEDVLVAINSITDDAGNQVFTADLQEAASQDYPQSPENVASFIRVRAHPAGPLPAMLTPTATILVQDDPGHTTARDLGLLTATSTGTFTTEDLGSQAPFTGPFTFDLHADGQTVAVTTIPGPPNDEAALAAALNADIAAALAGGGINNVSAAVTDNGDGTLTFTVTDAGTGGYFELEGTNDAARDLRLQRSRGDAPALLLGEAAFSVDEGLLGRDLDPALHTGTRLADLFGGQGLTLELDNVGNPRSPQGLRVTNGALQDTVDLLPLLQNPDATRADLQHAIERADIEADLRISADGRGVELVSRLSGTALKIEDFNGTLATQLGLANVLPDSRLHDLNSGLGVDNHEGVDFTLHTRGLQAVKVDLGGAATARELAAAINASPDNVNPSGTPPTFFTAQVYRERSFDSLPVANAALTTSFNVSFNGLPAEFVSAPASMGRTLAQLADELETGLNAAARRAGLDGYTVRVQPDAGGNFLQLRVEDENGTARIAFTGGDTAALGLAGTPQSDGEVRLLNEAAAERLAVTDNTFDPLTFVAGQQVPTVSQSAGAGTVNDLGLGAFDTAQGRFLSKDLSPRGQGSEGVFGAIADLVLALNADSAGAVGRGIDRLQAALDAVLDGRAEAGSRVQRLAQAKNRISVENQNLTALSGELMDVDMAEAAQKFQQSQVVLQAGLAATARIAQLSVFDFL